jgi:hypothetical protein
MMISSALVVDSTQFSASKQDAMQLSQRTCRHRLLIEAEISRINMKPIFVVKFESIGLSRFGETFPFTRFFFSKNKSLHNGPASRGFIRRGFVRAAFTRTRRGRRS